MIQLGVWCYRHRLLISLIAFMVMGTVMSIALWTGNRGSEIPVGLIVIAGLLSVPLALSSGTYYRMVGWFGDHLFVILAAAVLIGVVLLGLVDVVTSHKWPAFIAVVMAATIIVYIAIALHDIVPREVEVVLLSVVLGGQQWILAVIRIVPPRELVAFLQEHAFDFVGAAGLAVPAVYFATRRRTVYSIAGVMGTMAVIGALTGFTTKTGLVNVIATAVAGAGIGLFYGILASVAMPRPEWWLRLDVSNRDEGEAADPRPPHQASPGPTDILPTQPADAGQKPSGKVDSNKN